LGDVDAESWLEAEAAVEQIKTAPEPIEAPVTERLEIAEEEVVEPRPLATVLPEAHGSEELAQAREAMQEGAVEEGLVVYSALVEKSESLPFLIDDLETFYEDRGPEPGLQRVLGDAYARNGQLQKALRVYREALDNL
jgi:tetratricopeptide (TPR) repeat protein